MTIRFFILQAHYRSTLDFGNDALQAAEKGCAKLMEAITTLNQLHPVAESSFNVAEIKQECIDAINDDFNTPILLANLFEGVKIINSIKDGKATINNTDLEKLKKIYQDFAIDILGLNVMEENNDDLTDDVMGIILLLRKNAKENKDFNTADLIRDELDKKGIQIKDTREGSSWGIKK